MIGTITTEVACAVTNTPFERVSQYLKRGQVKLEMDAATPRSKGRQWLVMDVVKLAVLRELTDLGLSVGTAAEFVYNPQLEEKYGIWKALGCTASIMNPGAPQWFFIVTRDQNGASFQGSNSPQVARDILIPQDEDEPPKSALVVHCTVIARDIRRKLEAIGTA